jgi:hypothetical protein
MKLQFNEQESDKILLIPGSLPLLEVSRYGKHSGTICSELVAVLFRAAKEGTIQL